MDNKPNRISTQTHYYHYSLQNEPYYRWIRFIKYKNNSRGIRVIYLLRRPCNANRSHDNIAVSFYDVGCLYCIFVAVSVLERCCMIKFCCEPDITIISNVTTRWRFKLLIHECRGVSGLKTDISISSHEIWWCLWDPTKGLYLGIGSSIHLRTLISILRYMYINYK